SGGILPAAGQPSRSGAPWRSSGSNRGAHSQATARSDRDGKSAVRRPDHTVQRCTGRSKFLRGGSMSVVASDATSTAASKPPEPPPRHFDPLRPCKPETVREALQLQVGAAQKRAWVAESRAEGGDIYKAFDNRLALAEANDMESAA